MRKFNSLAEVDETEVKLPFIGLVDDKENGIYKSFIIDDEIGDRGILKVDPSTNNITVISAYPKSNEIWIYAGSDHRNEIDFTDTIISSATYSEKSGRTIYKLNRDFNEETDFLDNVENILKLLIQYEEEYESNWGTETRIKYYTDIFEIRIPNTVKYLPNWAFQNCPYVKKIMIPQSCTYIGEYAFDSCYNLTSIEIPTSIKKIESGTFYRCSRLNAITIPESVTFIGSEAFMYCNSLTSVHLPESINVLNERVFCYCHNLTDINITDSITDIKYQALSFTNISSINIPSNMTSIYLNGMFALTNIEIPFDNSEKIIEDSGFSLCCNIKNINIPDNITKIGDSAFTGCVNLHEIIIPRSVARIGYHNTCYNISKIIFLRTTPPNDSGLVSGYYQYIMGIFVPDESLSDYKEYYSSYASKIFPISVLPNADEYYERINNYEGIEIIDDDDSVDDEDNESGTTTQQEE